MEETLEMLQRINRENAVCLTLSFWCSMCMLSTWPVSKLKGNRGGMDLGEKGGGKSVGRETAGDMY